MVGNGAPAPGWYPDPNGPKGQQRYWTGSEWGPGPAATPAPGAPPPKRSLKFILGVVAALVFVAIVINSATSNDDETASSSPSSSTRSAPSTPTYSTRDYESGAIRTCQKAVSQGLKDPDSAQFGDDWKAWQVRTDARPTSVAYDPAAGDKYFNASGGVNAKNSFGGYVGFEPMYCEVVITASGDINAQAKSMKDLLTSLTPTPTP